ncbi:MAG: lipopolysaccharide transport periplasmic protein LptA [Saccharospirillum sp.]|nr:lipopolysaccharide transport periplasmic protein LptA [Saccharospirillum sp.]
MRWTHVNPLGRWLFSALLLIILAVLAALPAQALPEDRDLPITIDADEGTFRSRSGEASFQGNVYLRQGTLEVWADSLEIRRDPETGALQYLEARGQPARYQELPSVDGELIQVRGLRIEYLPAEDIIVTEGQGELEQANNRISAEFIRYHLLDETLEVRSRRSTQADQDAPQATWVIQPRELD